ncbi:TetR/AcrR family transcriptional regulator [Actinocorallia aurea]
MAKTNPSPGDGSGVARRPGRADGRRNYDAILTAARAAFEESGSAASLEDIAARAGVAVGTLYRHFPTREALVEAATREGLAALEAEAARLAGSPDPLAALTAWMRGAVRHLGTYRGLVGILANGAEGTPSGAVCGVLHASGSGLLAEAQAAGAVRRDVTPGDVLDLVTAAAWVHENTGRYDGVRFLHLFLSGITTHRM